MATPQDLERLRALLAQLTQIGNARRGELIRAEDWNTLVLSLADVARAVLATDATVAVPAHEHLDQVANSWLTPSLRDLLERGPLADPAMQQRLTAIEQTLRRLAQTQDGNSSKVEEFRGRLTEVASRDLERQSAITSVRRSLDTVVDPRPELQTMRNSLGAVQRDMTTVLAAAAQLSVDGTVVDLGGVLTRVTDLEALRERFRLANGELLDAATVERRLAEIDQRSVSPERLNEALNSHQFELSADQTGALEERLGTRLREQTNGVLDGFRSEIDTRVGTRLDGIGGLVGSRVADALPGLEASLTTALGTRIEGARQAAIDSAQEAAKLAIESSTAGLRADLGAQIGALSASVGTQVQTEVAQRLATGLAALRSSIDNASARLDALGSQVGKLDDTQQSHTTRLAALPQEIASLRNDLRQTLIGEVTLQVANVNRTLDERLTAFARDNDLKLLSMSTEISAKAVDAARRAAIESSQSSNAALRTQLLGEMRGIARDELNVTVNDSVRSAVNSAVSSQLATVPNLVTEEVRRQRLVVRTDTGRLPG